MTDDARTIDAEEPAETPPAPLPGAAEQPAWLRDAVARVRATPVPPDTVPALEFRP
jgi:hypothetical protein